MMKNQIFTSQFVEFRVKLRGISPKTGSYRIVKKKRLHLQKNHLQATHFITISPGSVEIIIRCHKLIWPYLARERSNIQLFIRGKTWHRTASKSNHFAILSYKSIERPQTMLIDVSNHRLFNVSWPVDYSFQQQRRGLQAGIVCPQRLSRSNTLPLKAIDYIWTRKPFRTSNYPQTMTMNEPS